LSPGLATKNLYAAARPSRLNARSSDVGFGTQRFQKNGCRAEGLVEIAGPSFPDSPQHPNLFVDRAGYVPNRIIDRVWCLRIERWPGLWRSRPECAQRLLDLDVNQDEQCSS